MADPTRGYWIPIERLYWASALLLGVGALVVESFSGIPEMIVLGALYVGVTLALFRRSSFAIRGHLFYSILSSLALFWTASDFSPIEGLGAHLAGLMALAVLAFGVFGGTRWAGVGVGLLALGLPELLWSQRFAMFGLYAFAAFIGVRIRGWLKAFADAQLAIDWLARHDPLTQLGNRRALEEAYARHTGDDFPPRFLSVWDLDGLKRINDEKGHAAGDAALRAFAHAVAREMRAEDRFFRTGGDEFVGLHASHEPPSGLIERVRRRFPGVSVGWAAIGPEGLEAAIAVADARMYQEKRQRASLG